jgi:hypothetical protein
MFRSLTTIPTVAIHIRNGAKRERELWLEQCHYAPEL